MSKLCKAFRIDKSDEEFDATTYIEKDKFIVEFNVKKLDIINEISKNNQIGVIQDGQFSTFYEIYQIEQRFLENSIDLKVYANKKLTNILSMDPKEEMVKSIKISVDNIHGFFQDSSFDIKSDEDNTNLMFKPKTFAIDTNQFSLKIEVDSKANYSQDYYNLSTITYFTFNYNIEKSLIDVLDDLRLLQYLFSYISNRRYEYKIIEISNIKSEIFYLEEPNKKYKNPKGLFVPDHNMIRSIPEFLKQVYESDTRLKKILSVFWDASSETTEDIKSIYTKWISSIEILYSIVISDKINGTYSETLKDVKSVINNSEELSESQKNIFLQRIKGLIDNPLREKLIAVFEKSNNLFYSIGSTEMEKNSDFLNKIINTRNEIVHPTDIDKVVFSQLELRKANTFLKCTTFIVLSKWLDVDFNNFRGYYYEKIKYFFDLIGYDQK